MLLNLYFQVFLLLERRFVQKSEQKHRPKIKKTTSGWRASLKNVFALAHEYVIQITFIIVKWDNVRK